jgi:protein-disulfide isomerase
MRKQYFNLNFLALILLVINLTAACATEPSTQTQTQPQTKGTAGQIPEEQIAGYIRKVFNVPSNVGVGVSKGETSTIPGMVSIKIQFTTERGTQVQEAWITPDNKTLLVGRTFDMSADPYKLNWSKVNLKNAPIHGAPDAKVTIVEYTDFQCPYCKNAHSTLNQIMKDYDGKVKLVYKSLPLQIHNWAQDSAIAAACVHEQSNDAFWKYADYLFENQQSITKDTLNSKVLGMAKENKVDETKLKACIDSKKTLPTVEADMKEAQSLGFNSTPSFVVNGRTVVGALPMDKFKQVVDEALASPN